MYPKPSHALDFTIEGMRSQQFSEAVFAFLLVGIITFTVIIAIFWFSKNRPEKPKLGEKIMFLAIIVGVLLAVVFGALQMLGGILF